MGMTSDVGPYLLNNKTGSKTALEKAGFKPTEDLKAWYGSLSEKDKIKANNALLTLPEAETENFNPVNYGIQSHSNLGEDEDIVADLEKLDKLLADSGTTPTATYPASTAGAQHVIPASAGATIVINIYPGGTAPVRVTGPDADMSSTAPQSDVHSPNQAQPSTSGPTQTIDAQMSKLANGIEHVKSLKEKVADKLQRLETLQNELQLQAKQLDMAMKKKLEENKDEG